MCGVSAIVTPPRRVVVIAEDLQGCGWISYEVDAEDVLDLLLSSHRESEPYATPSEAASALI